jgi:hypothetical protein
MKKKKVLLIGRLLPFEEKYAGRSGGAKLTAVWFCSAIARYRKAYLQAVETAGQYDGVIIDGEASKEGFSIEALEIALSSIGNGVKHLVLIMSHGELKYTLWRFDRVLRQIQFVRESRKFLVDNRGCVINPSPNKRDIVRAFRQNYPAVQAAKNWPEIFKVMFPPIPSLRELSLGAK